MRKNILLVAIAGLAVTAAALTGCSGAKNANDPEKAKEIFLNGMQNAQNVIENALPGEVKNEAVNVDVENGRVEIKTGGMHFRFSNNDKINFSEATYKEIVNFFNGKSFNVGDKIDLTQIKHTEDENESLEKAAKIFTYFNDYDKDSHTITITRPTSYILSYGAEGLDITIS